MTLLRAGSPWSRKTMAAITLLLVPCAVEAQDSAAPQSAAGEPAGSTSLQEVVVTAQRRDLLGTAATASEGVVTNEKIQLTPAFRPGQVLETVPGLVVTSHSGEGKANQYLLRGYNLDHGTDLATFVDGMPVNQPTHAHGQGYTDLNFFIPELADQLNYTKGPYYAEQGDFASVGSVGIDYRDDIENRIAVTTGTLDYQRALLTGSRQFAGGNLLGAAELQHYDGPWDVPDDARKENVVLRYSQGDGRNGYSITGMFYHQLWTNTTDIPERAIGEGLVPDRFGSLNPSDGGRAQRSSLSMRYYATPGGGQLEGDAYYVNNRLDMWHDFTHFLIDPINGDQEDQHEDRDTLGARLRYLLPARLLSFDNEFLAGAQLRYDANSVSRLPSLDRAPLPPSDDPATFSENDQVNLWATAIYAQATTHWTPWFRSVLGTRIDYQHGGDTDYLGALHETAGFTNSGAASRALFQPKGSLILKPSDHAEFYASAGRGYHSDDLRGITRSQSTGQTSASLIAGQFGEELGARITPMPKLAMTLAVFNLDAESETEYDADVGQDTAGPSSRRYGYEINATYKINRWLEYYGSFSEDHSHFKSPFDDGAGHLGTNMPNDPYTTGALALYLKNFHGWSGGLEYRYLGNFPLSSGPCSNAAVAADFSPSLTCATASTPQGQVNGKGYGEINLDARYDFGGGWSTALGVYNLLDTRRNAMEYFYIDRLQGESSHGTADTHIHPLEPISARLTISRSFGR